MTTAEILETARREEYEYCKKDIAYFIKNYCVIEDKSSAGVIVPFELWEGQKKALLSIEAHKFNIVLKARQLGISWLVIAVAVHTLLFCPGSTVIALSKTENEAKELVRRAGVMLSHLEEFITPEEEKTGAKYTLTVTEAKIYFKGGLISTFKSFPSSPSAARSFTANLIIFDEWAFQERAEEIWTAGLPTINRPDGGKVIGLSTIKLGTLFEKIWNESRIFNKIFLPWDTDPKRTPEWYEKTRELLGELIIQEYPASPEEAMQAPGGCFFSEFRRNIHVIEPFKIPEDWRRYMAIDYGLDMLAAIYGAVDPEGNIYIYKEVYKPELIISAACEAMREAEEGEGYIVRYAPGDLWGKSSTDGKTRIEHFTDGGFNFIAASRDRAAGWAAVKEWLKIYEDAEGKKTSRLKIFKNCVNLIRTLPAIARDEKKPDDVKTEPHELTHAPDALRYLLVMAPVAGLPEDKETIREYAEYESFLNFGE